MNREEAKLILQASRPGDEAAADSQLAAALALAKTDPELAAWFAGEQRWDATVRRELKTVPVPAGLRAQILARQTSVEKVVELPGARPEASFSFWRSPVIWAMAAAVVIFLGFAFNWLQPHPTGQLADFARDMIVASPDDTHHIDVMKTDLKQAQGWLADHHALANLDLPPAIKDAPGLMGCRIMEWHGQPVSMLCFIMKGAKHVDLFVTRASSISDAPAAGQPCFGMVNQQMTACWSTGGNVYLMTGPVPEEFLRHCLDPAATAQARPPAWFASAYQTNYYWE